MPIIDLGEKLIREKQEKDHDAEMAAEGARLQAKSHLRSLGVEGQVSIRVETGEPYFCIHQFPIPESVRLDNPRANVDFHSYCDVRRRVYQEAGSTGPCYFSANEVRLDTDKGRIVVLHQSNGYECPDFKPTQEVQLLAEIAMEDKKK
jgi:hypothetical protein